MKRRSQKIISLLLAFSHLFFVLSSQVSYAQQTPSPSPSPSSPQTTTPTNKTDEIISDFHITSSVKGRAKIKFDPAYSVQVDNRSTGRITVIGWDKDFIEATATSERGDEMVVVRSYDDKGTPVLYLKADYNSEFSFERIFDFDLFDRPTNQKNVDSKNKRIEQRELDKAQTIGERLDAKDRKPDERDKKEREKEKEQDSVKPVASPTPSASPVSPNVAESNKSPTIIYRDSSEIHIEVKLPRRAELIPFNVKRSDVDIKNIETPVKIFGAQSTISLGNVESAEVRTKSGDVTVENATGLVDITTSNGNIIVKNAKSDVRVLSISGAIDIRCARGRVNVSTTAGDITLSGASSDVDVSNTYGAILFTGTIQKDGRYYLKSMSGRVEMKIQSDPPGFLASLSSYRGKPETSFQLKTNETAVMQTSDNQTTSTEQRIKGTYGKGQALITLNSFDREVILTKATANELKSCGN